MNFIPEDKLNELLTDKLDFLFLLNMDGDIIEQNFAVTSIMGYAVGELKGKNLLAVYASEYKEKVCLMMSLVMKGDIASCPYPFTSKSNEIIPVDTNFFRGWWNEQNVIAAYSTNLSAEHFSNGLFYSIFNGSNVMMAISTFNPSIIININRAFKNNLGYSLDELSGKSVQQLGLFYYESEREKLLTQFNTEERAEGEITLKTKLGKLIVCLFSLEKIKVRENTYLLSAATDVSQQKIMEKKLAFLNRQQKLLVDVAQLLNKPGDFDDIINMALRLIGQHSNVSRVYIFENTLDDQYTSNTHEWCNEGIAPKKDFLQRLPFKQVPSFIKLLNQEGRIFAEKMHDLPADLAAAFAPLHIKSVLIYPIYLQNRLWGTVGFDECLQTKVWEEAEISLLLTVTRDITNALERKRHLNQFKDSEERLRLALSGAKEGMWDWNIQTNEVYFSDTCSTMLGYGPNELVDRGFKWQELIHPDDYPKVTAHFIKHLKGDTDYFESVFRIKDSAGKWKWVLDHGKVVERDNNNKPIRVIGTQIDISKQKKVEEQLQELLVTKDKLFSIISHDLRGPIGSFMQIIELLTSDMEVDPSMQVNLLNELKDMSKSTFYLLENLLNWSRSQRSDIVFNPRSFIINDLIHENTSLLAAAAGQKSIRIQFDIQTKFAAYADYDMINLVIRNLLSNAIKFTRTGGLILITIAQKEHFIETTFTDNGIGMSQEKSDNLFANNQFHSTSGTNGEKGSGLGLVLCKDFVLRNGGSIRVESTLEKGSTFTFTIPAKH